MRYAIVLLAATIMFAAGAEAQVVVREQNPPPYSATGTNWLPICNSQMGYGRCVDIVEGIDSGHAQMNAAGANIRRTYCYPAGTTIGTLTNVAVDYLRRNPQLAYMRFTDLVLLAWQQSFPCR